MKAIFACKLYKASTRQDVIKAALSNPVNSELVEQLESYINEDELAANGIDGTAVGGKPDKFVDGETGEGAKFDFDSPGGSHMPSGPRPSSGRGDDLGDEPELDDAGNPIEPSDIPDGEMETDGIESPEVDTPNTSSDEDIEEATKVVSTEDLTVNITKTTLSDRVKELLNNERVSIKDNELWAYYSDTVNLNTIMTEVIESIDNEFEYLTFNRLARTDNAIVFEITKPVTEDEVEDGED